MFDNLPFKTENLTTIKAFLNSTYLVFKDDHCTYKKDTGEELRTTKSKFKNLTFTVKYNENRVPQKLECRGSFHYLMNNGKHNANQYNFEEMRSFLLRFAKEFNIDLCDLELLPPEFAVNFPIPYDVEKVIQNVFYEKRKQFLSNSPGNPSKISGKKTNDYRLKVYSKYHEYPEYCLPNTLRLEYQAKKMRGLKRLGIQRISDLLIFENWVKLKEFHLSYFEHLVLYDYTIKIPKHSRYRKRIAELSNQNYWENLVKEIKKGTDYLTKYNDEVDTLNLLSKRYGKDILNNILLLANNQWNKNLKLCYSPSIFEVKKPKDAPLLKPKDAPFIECNPCTHYKLRKGRKCPVTGFAIFMQREDSGLLSNTGLKYLEENDREQFEFLKQRLLTGNPNKYEKDIYSMISKQIRNRYFNKPYNFIQPTLF